MIESLIKALIYILVLAACVFLVLWVMSIVGLALPAVIIKIIWAIFALICVLVLFRLLRPHAGNWLP